MRRQTYIQTLSAAVAISLITGCSFGLPIAQRTSAATESEQFFGQRQSLDGRLGMHRWNAGIAQQPTLRYACPATGALEYFSDYKNNVINVFAGNFAGQSPCGIITGLTNPQGLFVERSTHDLYVANTGRGNVLVFHRGRTAPFNTYADPSIPFPYDVTKATDGTVVASNIMGPYGGSLSTWVGGPKGGTFVGNFPMTNVKVGLWVTVKIDGTVYYNDIDRSSGVGALWFLKSPKGVCGTQSQAERVSFNAPGGLAISRSNDLLANEAQPGLGEIFELPYPYPKTFPIAAGSLDLAIDKSNRHWFALDSQNSDAAEYHYPSGVLMGTVQCAPGCVASGLAVDR